MRSEEKQVEGWWLMPVILATWETDIGRITDQPSQGKKISLDPISMEKSCIW
jgi:hypothetical protein